MASSLGDWSQVDAEIARNIWAAVIRLALADCATRSRAVHAAACRREAQAFLRSDFCAELCLELDISHEALVMLTARIEDRDPDACSRVRSVRVRENGRSTRGATR